MQDIEYRDPDEPYFGEGGNRSHDASTGCYQKLRGAGADGSQRIRGGGIDGT